MLRPYSRLETSLLPKQKTCRRSPVGTGERETLYYMVNGRAAAMRIKVTGETDELYYLHADHAGSTVLLTDAAGAWAGHVLYDAGWRLGGIITSTFSVTLVNHLDGGQPFDALTSLTYHGNGRYYDPLLGLEVQPRQVGGSPLLPQTSNRYAIPPTGSVLGQASGDWLSQESYLKDKIINESLEKLVGTIGAKMGIAEGFRLKVLRSSGFQYVRFRGQRNAFGRALLDSLTFEVVEKARAGDYWRMALRAKWGQGKARYAGQALLIKLGFGEGYDQVVGYGKIPCALDPYIPAGLHVEQWYSILKEETRLNWKGIGLEIGASVLADVALQVWYDSRDPFLSSTQRNWRLAIASVGGTLSGAAGVGGTLFGGAGVGWVLSAGVELVWQYAITPVLYEVFDLVGERRLVPFGEGN